MEDGVIELNDWMNIMSSLGGFHMALFWLLTHQGASRELKGKEYVRKDDSQLHLLALSSGCVWAPPPHKPSAGVDRSLNSGNLWNLWPGQGGEKVQELSAILLEMGKIKNKTTEQTNSALHFPIVSVGFLEVWGVY